MRLRVLVLVVIVSFGPAGIASAQAAPNLLVNGGAEAGAGSPDGYDVVPIPGWTSSHGATAVQYGAFGFPDADSPGALERGANFFAGGPNEQPTVIDHSELVQEIDLSSFATAVDQGDTPYTLCGFLGGYFTQLDGVTVTARFESDAAVELGAATIGPVTPADRGVITGMLLRTVSGIVPVATRKAVVTMSFDRDVRYGTYIDGYADNLALTLGDCPELPTTTSTSSSTSTTSSSSTSTSSTTSSSTTTSAPASTTPTTSPLPQSTTTTLPSDGCDGVPSGPTFASVGCRLAALDARVGDASGLGTFQSKSTRNVTTAGDRLRDAVGRCRSGSRKSSRASLKQVGRALTQFRKRLSGRAATKKLDPALRAALVDAARGIVDDVRRLRATLACTGSG